MCDILIHKYFYITCAIKICAKKIMCFKGIFFAIFSPSLCTHHPPPPPPHPHPPFATMYWEVSYKQHVFFESTFFTNIILFLSYSMITGTKIFHQFLQALHCSDRHLMHLYCLAVQVGLYRDREECKIVTLAVQVKSSAG